MYNSLFSAIKSSALILLFFKWKRLPWFWNIEIRILINLHKTVIRPEVDNCFNNNWNFIPNKDDNIHKGEVLQVRWTNEQCQA